MATWQRRQGALVSTNVAKLSLPGQDLSYYQAQTMTLPSRGIAQKLLNPCTHGLPDTVRKRIQSHISLAERIPNVQYIRSRARQSLSP